MKIVIDASTTQDIMKSNGVGVYARNIITHLIENFPNIKFVLLMYNAPSTMDEFLKYGKMNVEIVRVGKYISKDLKNLNWYISQLFPGYLILKNLKLVWETGDIFFCPYFWNGLPLRKYNSVVALHDFALPRLNIYSTISPLHNLARMITYWAEMLKVYLCEAIVTDSDYTTKDVFRYLPKFKQKRVYTTHLGIDLEEKESDISKYFPYDWRQRGYYIYLGGGTTKNKNSEGVIYAYATYVTKYCENVKPPYLVIAGKNFVDMKVKEVRKIHTLIERLGVKDHVIFTGRYEDSEKYSLMHNSIAYMHLSTLEGFGIAVGEAMRSKTPVIVHRGSSYIEVVGETGFLVDGLNPNGVAKAMHSAKTDRKLREQYVKDAYSRSKGFDWDSTAKRTYDVFKIVLGEK